MMLPASSWTRARSEAQKNVSAARRRGLLETAFPFVNAHLFGLEGVLIDGRNNPVLGFLNVRKIELMETWPSHRCT